MLQSQREEMVRLLSRNIINVPLVRRMVDDDVQTLEPFIDSLVRDAESRGKFEAYLAITEDIQRGMRVAGKFNRRAMDETLTPF